MRIVSSSQQPAPAWAKVLALLAMFPTGSVLAAQPASDAHDRWGVIERYCVECHNATDWAGSLAFDTLSFDGLAGDAKVWEATVRKLRAGFMPPPGTKERPDNATVKDLIGFLETRLDAAQAQPAAGRVPLRRLNQREYANAVRDLHRPHAGRRGVAAAGQAQGRLRQRRRAPAGLAVLSGPVPLRGAQRRAAGDRQCEGQAHHHDRTASAATW